MKKQKEIFWLILMIGTALSIILFRWKTAFHHAARDINNGNNENKVILSTQINSLSDKMTECHADPILVDTSWKKVIEFSTTKQIFQEVTMNYFAEQNKETWSIPSSPFPTPSNSATIPTNFTESSNFNPTFSPTPVPSLTLIPNPTITPDLTSSAALPPSESSQEAEANSENNGVNTIPIQTEGKYSLKFNDVGEIISGPYKGYRLVTAKFNYHYDTHDDSESGFTGFNVLRYLQIGNKLIFLPKISDTRFPTSPGFDPNKFITQTFERLHIEIAQDPSFTISIFESPLPNILLNGVCLKYYAYRDVDNKQVIHETEGYFGTKVGNHELYGEFKAVRKLLEATLPDNVILMYAYYPPKIETLLGSSFDRYTCLDRPFKRESRDDILRVSLDPTIVEKDLVKFKALPKLGSIYTLKSSNYPRIRNLYDEYKKSFQNLIYFHGDLKPDDTFQLDYETTRVHSKTKYPLFADPQGNQLGLQGFFNRIPLIYWQDPLGRWLRCENIDLQAPTMAEPLIYLYPTQAEIIHIRMDSKVHVREAIPEMTGQSWLVKAFPSGMIIPIHSSKVYPYLYWEGQSGFIPIPDQGFSVQRENIPEFLQEKLTLLGLNQKETQDFMKFWVPLLKEHPYYLINFYDTSFMNKLAPLQISPAPDTIIRIMMDYLPLKAPIQISPPKMVRAQPRHGFTVVEWGGLFR